MTNVQTKEIIKGRKRSLLFKVTTVDDGVRLDLRINDVPFPAGQVSEEAIRLMMYRELDYAITTLKREMDGMSLKATAGVV